MFSKEDVAALNDPVVDILRIISRKRGPIERFEDEKTKEKFKEYQDVIGDLYGALKKLADEYGIPFNTY